MSDHSPLIERVAARNPVPNLDDPPIGAWEVDVVRSAVTRRDKDMLTQQRPTQTARPPIAGRIGGWRVAFATFSVVLLAAGGLWLAARNLESGEVAGQPPTTNAPANEPERVALDTIVAYYTFNEAALRTLASTSSVDTVDSVVGDMLLDRAFNARTEAVTCTASEVASSPVTCQFATNDDLLAVFGIEDHPIEATVSLFGGGWIDVIFDRNFEAAPTLAAYFEGGIDRTMSAEGGVCDSDDRDLSEVDWDACASAFLTDARSWLAENG